jgi:anti-sigma28 factor (negative regulator of flagellin synthesis)
MAVPDVRSDKVAAARRTIAEGAFIVRADVIAWRMLEARG